MTFITIGESLNGSIIAVSQAIIHRDKTAIQALALEQIAAGVNYLDLNAKVMGRDEVSDLVWLVNSVREVSDIPLVLDSADYTVLVSVLAEVDWGNQAPIINSTTYDACHADTLLPLAKQYNTSIIALLMKDKQICRTAQERFVVCQALVEKARGYGIADQDLWIDPLILPVNSNEPVAQVCFELVRMVKAEFPQVRTCCGVSNVSFGLPGRALLNRAYIAMLAAHGIDGFIVNVCDREMRALISAARALLGGDQHRSGYVQAHSGGLLHC